MNKIIHTVLYITRHKRIIKTMKNIKFIKHGHDRNDIMPECQNVLMPLCRKAGMPECWNAGNAVMWNVEML